ncbi:MAG: cobalamin biosynthesis protein CbiD [Clostridia bacterium]|nr:cobalamin biosynthesis protein CbiD [Clostridia bacterium]
MTLRTGFTTGSCAAACALAACLWQTSGEAPSLVRITLPDGTVYTPEIHTLDRYRCSVFKDAGDDPDITDGCEVWAEVTPGTGDGPVTFAAGEGVGIITKPGLKLPPGEAAINPVPRQMIEQAVRTVYPTRSLRVTVGITGGRELAVRTFNPRLGITGGLSILGTTGIVHPMSESALIETIRLECEMHRAAGLEALCFVFGSQGESAINALRPDLQCVQISNFVGSALDIAAELGFSRILLAGQPGKLVKVAGGCMQTHSKYGDGRRETLCAHLALMGTPADLLKTVMSATTLDSLIPIIHSSGLSAVFPRLCQSACRYMSERAARIPSSHLKTGAMMLDGAGHIIGEYHES